MSIRTLKVLPWVLDRCGAATTTRTLMIRS